MARGVDISETALPGIGVRFDFLTRSGRRIGVVQQRGGRRELVVYDEDDPDTCRMHVALSDAEGDALAEILGAPRLAQRIAEVARQVEGVRSGHFTVAPGSPYDGRTLGDTAARTRTGASVVAVVRAGEVIASPTPAFGFEPGDEVVVVGTDEGTAAVGALLRDG